MSLSIDEKVKILSGKDVWQTKSFDGVSNIFMADGSHGVRKQIDHHDTTGKKGSVVATCFPTASLTACSFDRQVIKRVGLGVAKECRFYGVQMILGPGMNIKRSPLCGRNFEYFSEDPFLSGEMAASFVRSVEDQGVGTSIKHFLANNQESYRFNQDSIIDDRALHEIYLRNFKRVAKENPATIMTSYNKINGTYANEHPMIREVIRKRWKYQGAIISDWGAINHRVDSIYAGCDLEMPSSDGYWDEKIKEEASKNEVFQSYIEESASRILELANKYPKIENPEEIDFKKQHEQARMAARESMVLAKNNDNILPLTQNENIAMIGGFAFQMRYQGGGSSHVNASEVSEVNTVASNFSKNIKLAKGFNLNQNKPDSKLEAEAIELANQVKKVILYIGIPESIETEGFDRKTLDLPANQIELFKKIYEVNKNIVIVVVGGSVVNLQPFNDAKGVLLAYLGGQASSLAILDILYGKVSPSGRLAETWIDDINTCNIKITNDNNAVYYDESIYVGYRFYESFKKQVRYHFGHGLSYVKFQYKDYKVEENEQGYKVSVTVKNTGNMVAKDVIMIFIGHEESTVYKAKRELKAFDKVELKPNESKEVILQISKEDFYFYDIYKKKFIFMEGNYQIELCKHSGEVIESAEVHIHGRAIKHPLISYNQYEYNTSDFPKVFKDTLPPRKIVKKRPFKLSTTLNDVNHLLIGRIVRRFVIRIAQKEIKTIEESWLKEVILRTLFETPIRMLALFSNQSLSLKQAEGLVDILNLHLIKGTKKLISK